MTLRIFILERNLSAVWICQVVCTQHSSFSSCLNNRSSFYEREAIVPVPKWPVRQFAWRHSRLGPRLLGFVLLRREFVTHGPRLRTSKTRSDYLFPTRIAPPRCFFLFHQNAL